MTMVSVIDDIGPDPAGNNDMADIGVFGGEGGPAQDGDIGVSVAGSEPTISGRRYDRVAKWTVADDDDTRHSTTVRLCSRRY